VLQICHRYYVKSDNSVTHIFRTEDGFFTVQFISECNILTVLLSIYNVSHMLVCLASCLRSVSDSMIACSLIA